MKFEEEKVKNDYLLSSNDDQDYNQKISNFREKLFWHILEGDNEVAIHEAAKEAYVASKILYADFYYEEQEEEEEG